MPKSFSNLQKKRQANPPDIVITDKLKAYIEAAGDIFEDAEHKRSKPFTDTESTNKIERFHSTLKERTKVMRGLKDANSALAFTDGFIAYYNFIRPHDALDSRTPAEEAGIKYDVKNWTGVIRLGQIVKPEIISEMQIERRTIPGKPYKVGRKRKPRVTKPDNMQSLRIARL